MVPLALHLYVSVVVVGHCRSGLYRSGNHEPCVFANLREKRDQLAVACVETRSNSSEVRTLRQRMDCEYAVGAVFKDCAPGTVPRVADVALVGEDRHVVGATPSRRSTEVVESARRVPGRVDPQTKRSPRVFGRDRVESHTELLIDGHRDRSTTSEKCAHLVGRVGNRWVQHGVSFRRSKLQVLRCGGDEFLRADARGDLRHRIDRRAGRARQPARRCFTKTRRTERRRISALGIR